MSLYTSFQFFGTFLGGVIGGYLYDVYGLSGIFFFTAVISVVWMMKYIITKKYRSKCCQLIKSYY